jgi:periplasmic protein TonB
MGPALGLAVAAHAGLLYGLLREPADELAGGGGRLEAINVTIVNSTALESRDVDPVAPPAPAAAEVVEVKDGAAEAAPAMLQPKQAERQEKQAEQARAVDQLAPIAAIAEVSREAEKDPQKEEASNPSTIGGLAARGDAVSPARHSAPAAASPGAVREYARYVAQALAKARPKGVGGYGTVKVKLAISPGGSLATAEITRSSGNKRLDDTALTAVQRALLPVPPPGMTEAQLTYEVPYHFR